MTGRNRKRAVKGAITTLWCGISFVFLFPYLWMVLTGIRRPVDTVAMPPRLLFTPTLEGFRQIFRGVHFQSYLAKYLI